VAKRTVAAALLVMAACSCAASATLPRAWQAAALPAPDGGGRAEPGALAAGPPWLIGGAIQRPGQTEPIPAIWSSADGSRWQARALEPTTPDGAHTRILSVAVHGSVQVALGNRPSPLHGSARPTVWRAVGGGPFAEIPITRELFGGPNLISLGQVTASAQGFLVPGAWDTPAGVSAALWFSADGLAWTRVDSPAEFEPAGGQLVLANGASSGADQVILVGRTIGGAGVPAGLFRPAAWSAPRAVGPWATIPLAATGSPGVVDAVAVASDGRDGGAVVAVGWSGSRRRLTAWSPAAVAEPGRGWRARTLPGGPAAPPVGKDTAGVEVSASATEIVVLNVAGVGQASVWTARATGLQWTRLALPPGEEHAESLAVAVNATRILLLDPARLVIWRTSVPDAGR
jgi:hypothetical protein